MTRGGQTSAIIVRRPTGCPEEEVRAESCVRVKDQGGVEQARLARLCLVPAAVLGGLLGAWARLCHPGGHDFSIIPPLPSAAVTDWEFTRFLD